MNQVSESLPIIGEQRCTIRSLDTKYNKESTNISKILENQNGINNLKSLKVQRPVNIEFFDLKTEVKKGCIDQDQSSFIKTSLHPQI